MTITDNSPPIPNAPDCAFVICVEKGSLEYKALLLILTLRRNWGDWAKLPIYAYSPRKGKEPSEWLKTVYELYDVTPVYENLNTEFATYPVANKILAMAHAERVLAQKSLVFMDTDVLCWHPPACFALPNNVSLSLSVCATETVASRGPNDPRESMWSRLYKLAGITNEPPYVITQLTGVRVRGWWLSSVIPCKREAGLMNQWLDLFLMAVRNDFFPPEARAEYFRDQITLSLVAIRAIKHFAELPITHNYPVQNFDHYTRKGFPPESAVLWHYQPFLNKFFRKLAVQVDAAPDVAEKIAIAEANIARLRVHYRSMIGLDESLLQTWRRRLHLGPRMRRALGVPKPTDKVVMKSF